MLVSAFATLNTCSTVPPLNTRLKPERNARGQVFGIEVEQDVSAFIIADVKTRRSAQPRPSNNSAAVIGRVDGGCGKSAGSQRPKSARVKETSCTPSVNARST
jgi:hypothetical protein